MSRLPAARVWFQVALTGGFFGLLAWRVNVGNALATFPDANWFWVFPALAVFTLAKAVHTARWRIFLGGDRRIPLLGLLGIFLVANMANAVLLLRAGDVIRIQTAARRYSIPRSELTATVVVVETLLDGLAFVLLVAIAFSLGEMPAALKGTFWAMAGLALFGLALGVGSARWLKGENLHRIYPLRWLNADARERVVDVLREFLEGMRALREPRLAVPAIVLSVVGWLLEATSYWFFGQAFGLGLGFGGYLLVMMTANFAVAIPLTPSGLGPYEVATQELLVALNTERTIATAFAIGTHLSFIIWITVSGLAAMWLLRLKPSEVFYVKERSGEGTFRGPDSEAAPQPEPP